MGFSIPKAIMQFNPRVVPIARGSKGPTQKGWPSTELRAKELLENCDGTHDKYGIVLDDNMVVLDIDVHDGQENGFESLERVKMDLGVDLWEEAWMVVRSPSGGAHLYFHKSATQKLPGRLADYPAIDILSKGKQVIGPGSYHAELDGVYAIEQLRPTNFKLLLNSKFVEFCMPQPVPAAPPEPAPEPTNYAPEPESPLDDFNKGEGGVYHLKSEMEKAGYTFTTLGDGTYTFIRPGKTDQRFKISGSLGRRSQSGNRQLVNFSTSDAHFPSDGGITVAEAMRRLSGWEQNELPMKLRGLGYGGGLPVDQMAGRNVAEEMRAAREGKRGAEILEATSSFSLSELISKTPERREYLIKGLLRRGETMNVVAAPKTGKSWFVYNMAIAVALGDEFVGFEPADRLKTLIIDNELHREELSWRLQKVAGSRIRALGEMLHICPMRGLNCDIHGLQEMLEAAGASQFDVIVLDALYRFLPEGTSENDNAQMMMLYNRLDFLAGLFGVAIICIHHSSKGNIGERAVADAGAGAGAISRACDTQLVLYPHKVEEHIVIRAVTRSSQNPDDRSAEKTGFSFHLADLEPETAGKKPSKGAEVQQAVAADLKASRDGEEEEFQLSQSARDKLLEAVTWAVAENPGRVYSYAEIGEIAGVSLGTRTIGSYLRPLFQEGLIEKAGAQMFVSKRDDNGDTEKI